MKNYVAKLLLHDDRKDDKNGFRHIATFNIQVNNVTEDSIFQVLETVYMNSQNSFGSWITKEDSELKVCNDIDAVEMIAHDYNTKDPNNYNYVPESERVDGVEYYKFSRSSMITDVIELDGEYFFTSEYGFKKISEEVYNYLSTLSGRQARDLEYKMEAVLKNTKKVTDEITDVSELKRLLAEYYAG